MIAWIRRKSRAAEVSRIAGRGRCRIYTKHFFAVYKATTFRIFLAQHDPSLRCDIYRTNKLRQLLREQLTKRKPQEVIYT